MESAGLLGLGARPGPSRPPGLLGLILSLDPAAGGRSTPVLPPGSLPRAHQPLSSAARLIPPDPSPGCWCV